MKRIFLLLLCTVTVHQLYSQTYWQQRVDYRIDVSLNERDKSIDGFERLIYQNNSPDTLHYIWFHLWPNAYKNDRTAFSDQLLDNGNTTFYFSSEEQRGYINRLDFKVDGVTAATEDHPQHIDIVKVLLPQPLAPGKQITISTPFHVKLPFNISRGGYDGDAFQMTQWYPKPAVYDVNGWHPMPYLDQGEFYSEFGKYDVSISVPERFKVAATGVPHAGTEAAVKAGYRTMRFVQDSIHDFAWFADPNFHVRSDTCRLASGKVIQVNACYTPAQEKVWSNAVQYAKDALRFYSTELGEYPFAIATVVQGPESFGGGMEYPTITILSPASSAKDLDLTIAHELGHNWFYGILASNERQHPWMDEGMNTFYENKYELKKYGSRQHAEEIIFQTKAGNKTDQPIETPSEAFSEINYGLVAYHKTSEWLRVIETEVGEERFRQMMQEYYRTWQFKHPSPADFKQVVSKYLGAETDKFFNLIYQKGVLPGKQLSGSDVVTPFQKNWLQKYINDQVRHRYLLSPAVGFNMYDKLMVGGLVTNYNLPPNRFSFLLIPMFGTGSKELTGIGKLNYSITNHTVIRKTDLFLNVSRFSMDRFTDTAGNNTYMQFQKLVPGVRLTFKSSPRGTSRSYLQWKSYFISENSLSARRDTQITGTDTSFNWLYSFPRQNRYLNELQFVVDNERALYPYHLQLQVQHAEEFVRSSVTANYHFNYAGGGGLDMRFFAGKFFYLNGRNLQNRLSTARYHLNMSGPTGYEDYTYSDYFAGRNEFNNLWSQQMMMRDGGFKVRTDLYGLLNKAGKSDDWLLALNLSTIVPKKLNPLSVLPVKIPLKLFADVGTYAQPWQTSSELDRFIFDAGFSISLFKDVLNMYFPLIYSSVFSDYYKSAIPQNRFFKSMTFTINFYNKDLKKLNREAEF